MPLVASLAKGKRHAQMSHRGPYYLVFSSSAFTRALADISQLVRVFKGAIMTVALTMA